MDSPDRRLAASTAHQFGCFTADQATAAGFSARTRGERLAGGTWRALHAGVYCASTTPTSRARTATAARLRVEGAAFSHFTAARLLGIDVRHSDPAVWLRAPLASGHRSWPGVHVTRSRHSAEPVLVHGQPVTPAARTVVDLAGRLHDAQLTGMLYDVMRRRVVTGGGGGAGPRGGGGGRGGGAGARR